jgi:hypothetical protein
MKMKAANEHTCDKRNPCTAPLHPPSVAPAALTPALPFPSCVHLFCCWNLINNPCNCNSCNVGSLKSMCCSRKSGSSRQKQSGAKRQAGPTAAWRRWVGTAPAAARPCLRPAAHAGRLLCTPCQYQILPACQRRAVGRESGPDGGALGTLLRDHSRQDRRVAGSCLAQAAHPKHSTFQQRTLASPRLPAPPYHLLLRLAAFQHP